jgi:hypothetical protein
LLVEQAGGDLQKAVSSLTQQDLMTALEQQENSIQKLQEALLPFLNSIQKLEQLLREEITCATHTKQSLHTEEQLLFWKQLKRRIQDWKTLAHPLEGKPNPSAWEQLRESLKQHQDIQPLLENLHWTSLLKIMMKSVTSSNK